MQLRRNVSCGFFPARRGDFQLRCGFCRQVRTAGRRPGPRLWALPLRIPSRLRRRVRGGGGHWNLSKVPFRHRGALPRAPAGRCPAPAKGLCPLEILLPSAESQQLRRTSLIQNAVSRAPARAPGKRPSVLYVTHMKNSLPRRDSQGIYPLSRGSKGTASP